MMRPEDVPDELVEKAMREYLPGLYDTGAEAMRHALAAVLPEAQAQALRDAADEVSGYAWQPGDAPARVMPIEEQRAYMGGANDAHAIVGRLLRDRGARLIATAEPQEFTGHPFRPGRFDQARCQVMLARYRCPYPAEAHPATTEEPGDG